MSSVTSSYEDTLRTLRTGKNDTSPLNNLKRYMTWGQNTDSLPYATGKDNVAGSAQPSLLSWPTWGNSSANAATPFYDTFGLSMMQRYAAFGMCILGAALLLFLVPISMLDFNSF
jgi:hypothetical protein